MKIFYLILGAALTMCGPLLIEAVHFEKEWTKWIPVLCIYLGIAFMIAGIYS